MNKWHSKSKVSRNNEKSTVCKFTVRRVQYNKICEEKNTVRSKCS